MIGIDIIEIDRIESVLARFGDRFTSKIFTESECAYCDASAKPSERYAARFAAKEAIAKVVKDGPSGWYWRQIEIQKQESGAPKVVLSGELRASYPHQIVVSFSHSRDYVAAVALQVGS